MIKQNIDRSDMGSVTSSLFFIVMHYLTLSFSLVKQCYCSQSVVYFDLNFSSVRSIIVMTIFIRSNNYCMFTRVLLERSFVYARDRRKKIYKRNKRKELIAANDNILQSWWIFIVYSHHSAPNSG